MRRQAIDACLARLNQEGYRQHLVSQPANRFWTLQWAETGLFLGVSGLLAVLLLVGPPPPDISRERIAAVRGFPN